MYIYTYTYTHTHIQTYTRAASEEKRASRPSRDSRAKQFPRKNRIRMIRNYVCIYIYIYTYIYIYIYNTHMYANVTCSNYMINCMIELYTVI